MLVLDSDARRPRRSASSRATTFCGPSGARAAGCRVVVRVHRVICMGTERQSTTYGPRLPGGPGGSSTGTGSGSVGGVSGKSLSSRSRSRSGFGGVDGLSGGSGVFMRSTVRWTDHFDVRCVISIQAENAPGPTTCRRVMDRVRWAEAAPSSSISVSSAHDEWNPPAGGHVDPQLRARRCWPSARPRDGGQS